MFSTKHFCVFVIEFYSGMEKRYLVRLITLRRPFDSASRNNPAIGGQIGK